MAIRMGGAKMREVSLSATTAGIYRRERWIRDQAYPRNTHHGLGRDWIREFSHIGCPQQKHAPNKTGPGAASIEGN
jgi:hypothetical protein